MQKLLKISLLILWCLLIFMFSSENGDKSASRSQVITNNAVDKYEEVFDKEVENRDKVVDNLEVVIRKSAHFTLYFILGILTFINFNDLDISVKKKTIYALIFCVCYAISDELHQLFVSERGSKIMDVFIDSLGSLTGITIVWFLLDKFKYRFKLKELLVK